MEGSFQPTGSEQESNRSSEGNLPRNELEVIQTAKPSARKGVIRRLREAKGWSQQALADKAVVSFKTISSLEQGKRAQLSTFRKVADKLGVEPGELIEQDAPEPPPDTPPATRQDKRVQITLTLSIPFQDFDESDDLTNLVQMLASLIKAKHEIGVVNVSSGSVKITLEMDRTDLTELIVAFMAYRLKDTQITALEVLSDDFPMPENLPKDLNEQYRANWHYIQAQKDALNTLPAGPSQSDSDDMPGE